MSSSSAMSAITEETLVKQVRYLLFWNRVWITLLCIVVLFSTVLLVFQRIDKEVYRIRVRWHDDQLTMSSPRGHKLITHLTGYSEGTQIPVGARLPTPLFLLDSEVARINKKEYEALVWQSEGGFPVKAPPFDSKIQCLYISLQTTE